MAIQSPPAGTKRLTYEQYMAEGHIEGRYDILDGVRIFLSGASWPHQKIVINIILLVNHYKETSGNGEVMTAPLDVLIRRVPRLQTRQPDVLYISHAQLECGGGVPERGALEIAPEIIVEVISDTETQRETDDKLADYLSIGVREGWLVRRAERRVDVVRLSPDGPVTVATYDETQTLQSLTFSDLRLAVADFFR